MKTFILIIVLLIPLKNLTGQQTMTFIEADTSTFRAYLDSDWDKIIEVGTTAIDNGIDYYYLRLRIAYAYYMKGRYHKAIPQYKKLLEFSTNDPTALEYLFYCYRYTARDADAEKLAGKFTPALKNYLGKEDRKPLTGLGINTTYGTGSDPSLKDDVSQSAPQNLEGSQILPNSYMNFKFGISHGIQRNLILNHSANLLSKDEYAFAVVNSTPYISESQTIRQFSYHLSADVTPVEGLTLSPVFSFINYRIPIFYDYGAGSGKNRSVYSYDSHSELVVGVKAEKNLGVFTLSLAGSRSNLNLSKQNTAAASLTILPLGNLNLYLTANGYLHGQKQKDAAIQQFMHSYTLGFKIAKHLWLEGYSTFGEFSNLYDPFSELTYNSLELYRNISSLSLIVPLYKSGASLFAGARFYSSESMFVPVDGVFATTNSREINYQSYTFGISWKL